jgi:inosose dehydratase
MIKIANAPCSWGTIEGRGTGVPYAQMLDELVETGYEGTELGDLGYMPTDPERLRDELERRDLTMLGAYEGVNLRDPDVLSVARARISTIARLLAAVKDVGDRRRAPYFILADDNGRNRERTRYAGRVAPELSLSRDEWARFARNAEEVALLVAGETGLKTVFHPHCAGFVETPTEIERLCDATDPELIGLVFDTGHYTYGTGWDDDGSAALTGLQRYWERIWYVHFKDCHPEVASRARREGWDYTEAVKHGVFCELGQGSVDFAAIVAFLKDAGYDDWITVEQDVLPGMGTPKESARRNREYLRGLGL